MPYLRRILLLCLSLLMLVSAACTSLPARASWALEDLLLLDPLDAPTSSLDILALYARPISAGWLLRLDMLDLPRQPDYDLEFLLETNLGEVTIRIPANGKPSLSPAQPGWLVRLIRDARLDTVTVRLICPGLQPPFSLRAASHLPGEAASAAPADETALVRTDALPPLNRAPVLLAFWDVFPAATPAQALRRWWGAHTGPAGGRHGLKYVLDAAEAARLPVALLDLKTPASLAALSLTGHALRQVRRMAQDGLLILPDAAWSQSAGESLAYSRAAAAGFDLPGSLFAWSPLPEMHPGYRFQFLPLPDASRLAAQDGVHLIPLPTWQGSQVDADGPVLEVRRALLQAALSPEPADLLVLGGSLPVSAWGAGDTAPHAFAWLAAHPWVWMLDGYELQTFPLTARADLPSPAAPADPWLSALRIAPDNAVTRSAWQTYLMLNAPTTDTALQSLRDAYAGQVGILLAAASWAEDPLPRLDCASDPDRDGSAECILADERTFAVFELGGARLTHLFLLEKDGPHQVVAPTTQFTVGLSDPSLWHPALGELADPAALMGAFSDQSGTYDLFQVSISDGLLTFTGIDRVKTFQLAEDGLLATYLSSLPVSTRIPLAVDPQLFFTGFTSWQARLAPATWTWGLAGGFKVQVRTDGQLAARGFTTTRAFFDLPEDPDRDYGAGHFIPYPLSLVTVRGEGGLTVWIGGE